MFKLCNVHFPQKLKRMHLSNEIAWKIAEKLMTREVINIESVWNAIFTKNVTVHQNPFGRFLHNTEKVTIFWKYIFFFCSFKSCKMRTVTIDREKEANKKKHVHQKCSCVRLRCNMTQIKDLLAQLKYSIAYSQCAATAGKWCKITTSLYDSSFQIIRWLCDLNILLLIWAE